MIPLILFSALARVCQITRDHDPLVIVRLLAYAVPTRARVCVCVSVCVFVCVCVRVCART